MSEYGAVIAKITEVKEIRGAAFIQSARVLGEWVIVKKDFGVGSVGVFFPVGSALSPKMCNQNNLYRKADSNIDPNVVGFLDPNGRIVALKLRGAISAGLFLPLNSLAWTGTNVEGLNSCIGKSFTEILGNPVCDRYNPPSAQEKTAANKAKSMRGKLSAGFSAPYFDKHVTTRQFKMTSAEIQKGNVLYFHNKRHGTSSRVSKGKVDLKLPRWKHLVNRFVKVFPTSEYRLLVGSRNVVLNEKADGFYGANDFRHRVAKDLEPHLKAGMTIYSEICGYVGPQTMVMPVHDVTKTKDKAIIERFGKEVKYTYGCEPGELTNFIYRITITTDDGLIMDMPQRVMEQWCRDRELLHTFEVHPPILYDGDVDALNKLLEELTERPDHLTADPEYPDQIAEGIIVREECGELIPKFYKSKSFWFRLLEGHNVYRDLEEDS